MRASDDGLRSSPRDPTAGTESLDKFSQMVKSATVMANRLSSNELLTAFQISFNLIEKISDIMLNTCSENKTCQNDHPDHEEPWKYHNLSISPRDFHSESSCRMRSSEVEMDGTVDRNPTDKQLKVITDANSDYLDESDVDTCKIAFDKNIQEKHDANGELIISPDTANTPHSPSPPVTNESSVSDANEIHQEDEVLDSDCIPNSSDIRPNSYDTVQVDDTDPTKCPQKTNYGCRKSVQDRRSTKGVLPTSDNAEDQDSVELKDLQMGFRLQNDLRRWRLTNTDKLNTLIDECERQLNGRKLYVCKFCGKVYEIKSSMRYHMKIIHLQMHLRTTEMQCRICGKQFTCVSAVNRHQSKCMLSNLAESRFRKSKLSHPFATSPTLDTDGGHQLSTPSFNVSTSPTTSCLGPNCASGPLFSDSNSMITDNFLTSSLTTQKPNLHSAFRIPDSMQRSVPNPFNLPTNLEAVKMIPPNQPYNYTGNTEDHNFLSYPLTSTCDMKSCLIPPTNSVDSFDSSWSAAMFSSFPNLGCNFSELTPAQINMCMKAVVQGIRSTVERTGNANTETNPLIPIVEPDQTRCDETSWPSTNCFRPPSDSSDQEPNLTAGTSDMAIDLSSRPRSTSMMIESF